MEEQRQRQDTSKPEGEGGATTTPAAGGNTEASTGGTEDSLLMNAMYPGGVRN